MTNTLAALLIVGVGNPDRGDDALGHLAARRLAELQIPGVRVLFRSADIIGLVEDWRAAPGVILIDAAQVQPSATEDRPAAIHRIDVSARPLTKPLAERSTHGFGVAETVELARALGSLPPRVIVYAVEGRCFEIGAPLSPKVAATMDGLVAQVESEARSMAVELASAQFF